MRLLSLIALLCALAIPVAGCGDDDESDGGGASTSEQPAETQAETSEEPAAGGGEVQVIKIAADPSGAPKFDKSSLTAKPGKVTISMDNPSSVPHAVEIEGNGVEVAGETVQKDGVSKATADVKPGEYEFYCPVDGHRQAGMEGTLTVK